MSIVIGIWSDGPRRGSRPRPSPGPAEGESKWGKDENRIESAQLISRRPRADRFPPASSEAIHSPAPRLLRRLLGLAPACLLPPAQGLVEHARSRRGAQEGRSLRGQARARASGVTGRSRRVGKIGWVEWYGQVV